MVGCVKGYTLEMLEERIGYKFGNQALLKQALTHSSFTNERRIYKTENYERLEFLGDAVLELVSSEFLFRAHGSVPEGELTKMRAAMVCEPSLAFCARDLELGQFILLGKGEDNTGGRERDSIISDVMEAVIGAIYLDGGMGPARGYIERFILSDLEDKQLFYDSKSTLQEMLADDDPRKALVSENLITYVEDRKGHDRRYAIAPDKIRDEIGWEPETMFKEGIRRTIQWFFEHEDWMKNVTSGDYQKYYAEYYQS